MTLREKINHILNGLDDIHLLSDAAYREARDTATDSILAAVREEMLSDEVVEGVIIAYLNGQPSHGGFVYDIISHAITAAGITESEVENDTD